MKTILMGASFALALAQAATAATFTVYTDRSSFEAATGPLSGEDFNGVVGEPQFRNQDLTVGGLTLRNEMAGNRGFIDQPPFQFGVFDIDGTAVANLFTSQDNDISVQLSFGEAITAFAADFASLNDGILRTVFDVLGETIIPDVQPTSGADVQFFGFTSDMAFTSLTLRGAVANDADGFSMDNVVWDGTPVPLPAGGLLLLSAIGLLAARRRFG